MKAERVSGRNPRRRNEKGAEMTSQGQTADEPMDALREEMRGILARLETWRERRRVELFVAFTRGLAVRETLPRGTEIVWTTAGVVRRDPGAGPAQCRSDRPFVPEAMTAGRLAEHLESREACFGFQLEILRTPADAHFYDCPAHPETERPWRGECDCFDERERGPEAVRGLIAVCPSCEGLGRCGLHEEDFCRQCEGLGGFYRNGGQS